jgi:hypothetical protein
MLSVVLIVLFQKVFSQDSIPGISGNSAIRKTETGGFFRGGFYLWNNKADNNVYIPHAFSDVGFTLNTGDGKTYKAFGDLRYRYGVQFGEPVSTVELREGYIRLNGKLWNFSAGQKIIKRGRADFNNPTSKLSPTNFLFRSPDREDMNMGNLLSEVQWFPSPHLNFEAVAVPFYRSSVLITDPVPLPANVKFNKINSILTDSKYFSYGLKADFHFSGVDWSLSWFDGFDPMPGIALSKFSLDLNQSIPLASTELSEKPYKERVAGADFETTIGNYGLRGEAAWSFPSSSGGSDEYVPMPEIKWVIGSDCFSGNWHFTWEYNGKYITKFTTNNVKPILGTEQDYSQILSLLSDPLFDMNEYVRQEVTAFNRLYNYQIHKYYHGISFRVETDFIYGKLAPSIFTTYNFTSRDLLFIPEMKYKPSDGLAITAGAEIYHGEKGSLYDLIDDFMNGFYVSLRIDF